MAATRIDTFHHVLIARNTPISYSAGKVKMTKNLPREKENKTRLKIAASSFSSSVVSTDAVLSTVQSTLRTSFYGNLGGKNPSLQ